VRRTLAILVKDPGRTLAAIDQVEKGSENATPSAKDAGRRALEESLKNLTPADIARAYPRAGGYFRSLLALKNTPVPQWREEQYDPRRMDDGSVYTRIAIPLMPAIRSAAEAEAWVLAQIRGSECLAALKLWRARNQLAPSDLAAVVKAAGLPRVPIDPFSGQPLRMAIIDGEPVVYSIGKDGRDDGGRVDSARDRKPGDVTFRLPAGEKRKR
jgi:hypothetical protein